MQTPQPTLLYTTKLQEFSAASDALNKKIKRIMTFRLLAMVLTFLLFIYVLTKYGILTLTNIML